MATQTDINSNSDYASPMAATRLLSVVLAVAFLLSGAYVGHLLREAVREVVANAEVPSLPYVDLALPSSIGGGETVFGIVPQRGGEIPITGITGVPLPDYKKQERVNILLLGIDKRPNEQFARTDTIILVTVDPENKTAGMLSIPRDLWIDIPGYPTSRINTAYYLGEKYGHPGGGAALAMQTVQQDFGVPVHFYVKVDFDGFYEIVDTLGGIEVDVPYAIHDDRFPDNNYGYDPFHIEAGRQHLDAQTTLKYVRSRHAPGSDFGRAARQQQVLMAIKNKALQLGMLPKLPELWVTMAGSVETNLQLVDIKELAALGDQISPGDITTAVLDYEYTVAYETEDGAQVLLPLYEKIRPLVDQMFAEVEASGPTQAEMIAAQATLATQQAELLAQEQQRAELKTQLAAEGASIIIQNGTNNPGLETETALFLREQGFNIIQSGPADLQNQNYPKTVIVDYSGKEYTLGTLAKFFNVTEENIRRSPVTSVRSDIDIRVIIGADFTLPDIAQPSSSLLK